MTSPFKSKVNLRGRKHLEFLPPVDAQTLRSESASGLMFRDAWRSENVESLEEIERRTCRMYDGQSVRVVVLPGGEMKRAGATAASSIVSVPWTSMPEPLSIALPDGTMSKMGEVLSEVHNLVHFRWGEADDAKHKLLDLAKGIHEALTLRTTHEGRSVRPNSATWLQRCMCCCVL